MKRCDKCDVDIMDDINNCPLCGRNISTEKIEHQTFLCYPDNKVWVNKRNAFLKALLLFSIIGMLISIFLELLLFKRFWYNAYVVTGEALFLICIYMPLKFRWSFSNASLVVGLTICAYIIFLELFTNSFGWGVYYVVPLFILFMSLYSTFIIMLRNYYKGFEFIRCLLMFALCGVAIFTYNTLSGGVLWPSLVVFLTSVTCFVIFLFFRFKKVKNQFEKSFFI